MSFEVSATAYGTFMGQYSEPLATEFLNLALSGTKGDLPDASALDVGCGPGALTARLVDRFGAGSISAIDPSASFVDALAARLPGIDIRQGVAEQLPFADDEFDLTLAQLVVHFMPDPVAGLTEMARVTRPSGVVAACTWDHAGRGGPLSTFWQAVTELDPNARDESALPGAREGDLLALFRAVGLADGQATTLTVRVPFETFDQWWQPYLLGVGPAGEYVARLNDAARERVRARCAELLPSPPFEVSASAWSVLAHA